MSYDIIAQYFVRVKWALTSSNNPYHCMTVSTHISLIAHRMAFTRRLARCDRCLTTRRAPTSCQFTRLRAPCLFDAAPTPSPARTGENECRRFALFPEMAAVGAKMRICLSGLCSWYSSNNLKTVTNYSKTGLWAITYNNNNLFMGNNLYSK